MRSTLKKRIISGFTVFSLIVSTLAPAVPAFGDDEVESCLYEVMSETTDTAEVTVFSSSDDSEVICATETDAEIETVEGLEVLESFTISDREEGSEAEESLWVKAEQDENIILQPEESMSIYSVEDNEVGELIIEDIAEEDEPCEIDSEVTGLALVKDSGYRHLNLTLNPMDSSDKLITLDGMMPKNAFAEAVDVNDPLSIYSSQSYASQTDASQTDASQTDADSADLSSIGADDEAGDYRIIAAYDITINDGENEYQPSSDRPIAVTIADPQITSDSDLRIIHVKDDGEEEEITDFTIEEGEVHFSAVGFSVYKIVTGPELPQQVTYEDYDKNALVGTRAEEGFVLLYGTNNYYTNELNENGCLKTTTAVSKASRFYFESTGDAGEYKIYTYVEGIKKYIHNMPIDESEPEENRTDLKLELSDDGDIICITKAKDNAFYLQKKDESKYLQYSNGGKGIRYYPDNSATSASIKICYGDSIVSRDDFFNLDGKTYGLMYYSSGTHGYAMMGEGNDIHSLIELVTHKTAKKDSSIFFVDEDSEVTRWTFHKITKNNYKLSAEIDGETKYLAVNGDSLILAESEESGATFKANVLGDGRIQLQSAGNYVTFTTTETEDGTVYSYTLASQNTNSTKLNLIEFADLSNSDYITYSAERISVSDIQDGQKVIVYIRIWDDEEKRYSMYAVDHDGSLYPVYASGGKILWLGDGTSSLEWVFTEYLDDITKQPNYYYELYNPYSELYIAPQMNNDQVLSEGTIGINLQGRREGDYYSKIIAWDNSRYAYIGLKPDANKKELIPCSESVSYDFYFATLEELNLSDRLHEVSTIDNDDYGITMRMFDFNGKDNDLKNSDVTKNYFGGNYSNIQGLLYTDLKYDGSEGDVGYPQILTEYSGKSFREMYSGAQTVNHLFIESVYNSSGYFEFDSCQNFATLNTETGNFTVYNELGTTDATSKNTLKHGQFFPYNTITAGVYSSRNTYNEYGMNALVSGGTSGALSEDDPRKYEKLLKIQDPNYFFGMEMSAKFVQTVSGLDAWGHDIIFEFTGDDDFWLYVDGELVLDLGGTHSAEGGTVNFRTGEISLNLVDSKNSKRWTEYTTLYDQFKKNYTAREFTEDQINAKLDEIFDQNENGQYIFKDYTTHTMRVFYMERGAGASNLHMKFNIASVTPGNVVMSKTVSGDGADSLDTDFLEYPFQIYYKIPDDNTEYLLSDDHEHIHVTYQNSNQPVNFVQTYRPPGVSDEDAYHNIYFINPTKNIEIAFPENAISYRIVECAVDTSVYKNVKINGQDVPPERKETNGNYVSYSSELGSAEKKPVIAFENYVEDDVIKDLKITKKLYTDENCTTEITGDPGTFSFRLYLSSVDVAVDDMQLANMHNYYVISPAGNICRFDPNIGSFAETNPVIEYNHDNIQKIKDGEYTGIDINDVTFTTSGFGAISDIPVGYTICVPGLPVGSIFKVTEDVKEGYGLVGTEIVMGEKITDGQVQELPSYYVYGGGSHNVGRVRGEFDAQMIMQNVKGYSLTANKKWSDQSITTGHQSVYVAVYAKNGDNEELLDGSVREIKSPATSAYYFWTTLPDVNGHSHTTLDDYLVKEVVLTGNNIEVINGVVSGYETVTPLGNGAKTTLTATRTQDTTPEGEESDAEFEYVVTYEKGTAEGSIRTDTISNTRTGGIAIRLFKWHSATPLKGGQFTLSDSDGKTLGTYTSDSEGIVTMLYSFEKDKLYTLTETMSPEGYVGLNKKLSFKVNQNDTVSLYYEDGTTAWGEDDSGDNDWAKWKAGINGITAYVDIYNKPLNFKIVKMDSADSTQLLDDAHFALYKQANPPINGYSKNKKPMTGFEDLVTNVNGEVQICGGDTGRVIKPGANGSVYFLTETQAPSEYSKLSSDIIFSVSPLGRPFMISDPNAGNLVDAGDCYIYTLSVSNTKIPENSLTITKTIDGAYGDKTKEFEFTFITTDVDTSTEYDWYKNDVLQTKKIKSGDKFNLGDGDTVKILFKGDISVRITEKNENYTPEFKLGTETVGENTNTRLILVNGDLKLKVTNTLDGRVPTGIWLPVGILLVGAAAIGLAILGSKRRIRRLKEYEKEDK